MPDTPEELEMMRKLTADKEARKEQRLVNEQARTIPCRVCGRTVMQVMAERAKKIEAGEEAGLGGFEEKDGKTVFLCVDCGSKPPV